MFRVRTCTKMACQQCSLDTPAESTSVSSFPQARLDLYQQFSDYYGNPLLTKVEFSHPQFSMYVARVNTMLAENRYLIAICPLDRNPIGTQIRLAFLRWVSFQARASKTQYRCNAFSYHPTPTVVSSSPLIQVSSNIQKSVYHSPHYPLTVELLGDKNYHSTGTLGECLESFSTVVTQN